jgi:Integrase zinc binding domain
MPSSSTSSDAAPSAMAVVPEPVRPPPLFDLGVLAEAQASCPDCARAATSPALHAVMVEVQGYKIWVDTSSGVMRPLVPAALRRQVFAAVHSLAHPGIRASLRIIVNRYLWPGLAKDVASWCCDCTARRKWWPMCRAEEMPGTSAWTCQLP